MVGVQLEGVGTVEDGGWVVTASLLADEDATLEKSVEEASVAVVDEAENIELAPEVETAVDAALELAAGVDDCTESELELETNVTEGAGVELAAADRVSDAGTLIETELLDTASVLGSIFRSPIASPEPA